MLGQDAQSRPAGAPCCQSSGEAVGERCVASASLRGSQCGMCTQQRHERCVRQLRNRSGPHDRLRPRPGSPDISMTRNLRVQIARIPTGVFTPLKNLAISPAAGMGRSREMKNFAQIQEWPLHVGTSVEKSRSAYPGSRGSSRIDQMTASGDRDRTDDFELLDADCAHEPKACRAPRSVIRVHMIV